MSDSIGKRAVREAEEMGNNLSLDGTKARVTQFSQVG